VTFCAWDPIIYDDEPGSLSKPDVGKNKIGIHGQIRRYRSELFPYSCHSYWCFDMLGAVAAVFMIM
jgi:hypothetical protein